MATFAKLDEWTEEVFSSQLGIQVLTNVYQIKTHHASSFLNIWWIVVW